MKQWGQDDYAASDPFSRYVVVASPQYMGGRANDGFDQFNLLLRYHRNGSHSRMKLIMAGPTLPGHTYEGLVNYDIPHSAPSYWNEERRMRLSPTALAACLKYYPPRIPGTSCPLSTKSRGKRLFQQLHASEIPTCPIPPRTLPWSAYKAKKRPLKRPLMQQIRGQADLSGFLKNKHDPHATTPSSFQRRLTNTMCIQETAPYTANTCAVSSPNSCGMPPLDAPAR